MAGLGHRVVCLDIDERKIKKLQSGSVPFHEPGLEPLLYQDGNAARVSFTTDYAEALKGQDFVFIAVNTPPTPSGRPNMSQITSAARSIARYVEGGTIIVNKSTGPVGMADLIARILAEHDQDGCPVVANPEFLREGHGVYDFMHPYQVVIGSWDPEAAKEVGKLYQSLDRPIIYCDPKTAEMTKLVSNAFRAVKVSFINEIANICEQLQVDVTQVAQMIGADKAIGPAFLSAGVGWGGNCLPKDVITLQYVAKSNNVRPKMLQAALEINQKQRKGVVEKLRAMLGHLEGKRIGVLGLAYKAGTDDMRAAPAIDVIQGLQKEGALIKAYDPMARRAAEVVLSNVIFCDDAYSAAEGCDALVLLTDWPEFKELDLKRLRSLVAQPFFVDGRNLFHPVQMAEAGFVYRGTGRGYLAHLSRQNPRAARAVYLGRESGTGD